MKPAMATPSPATRAPAPEAAGGVPGPADRRVRVDMHLHTRRSFDCLCDPERVLATARSRGIDRICVTDHDEIAAALELRARHPEHVIVGEEVKTAERVDVIGLYLHERIPRGTPARETCLRIREQGGIVYIPHPFVGRKGAGERFLAGVEDLVDAVEGFNGRAHVARLNQRAVDWAEARGLPVGAGSDAHSLLEVGRTYVETPPFQDDAQAFLAALRRGRIHGQLSSWGVHLLSTWAKVRKRLPGGRP